MSKAGKMVKFQFGLEWAYLKVGDTADSEFTLFSFDSSLPICTIGLNEPTEGQLFASLLHELVEASYVRLGLAYTKYGWLNNNAADLYFTLNHSEHSEVCERAGRAAAKVWPILLRSWKAWRKEKK